VCRSLGGVFLLTSAMSAIAVPRERLAIRVLTVGRSATMSVQARVIGSASGQIQTTHLGGASPQIPAKLAIAAHKVHLAIHAHMVGRSTTMNVLGGETASAIGTHITTVSLDGVFHINRAMLGTAARKEHLATPAHMVGRSVMVCVREKGTGAASWYPHQSPVGAFPVQHVIEAIVAPREVLAIHAHMVGWSVMKFVLARGIASAIGPPTMTVSQDGFFQTRCVMLATAVRRGLLATLAQMVGRSTTMNAQARGTASANMVTQPQQQQPAGARVAASSIGRVRWETAWGR